MSDKLPTPMRAIRLKCMDCTCQQIVEVRECAATDCPLRPYRMGHNPNRKGKGGNLAGLAKARLSQTKPTQQAL